MPEVRATSSADLSVAELDALRSLFDAAWPGKGGRFTELDFQHAIGGVHLVVEEGPAIVAHASVVSRHLNTGGVDLATGYVEAVATRPDRQGRGLATAVMRRVNDLIDRRYELGALDTGIPRFYEQLGWETWRGPTAVRPTSGPALRTPEEDGAVMVRRVRDRELDLEQLITCDWRDGDVW